MREKLHDRDFLTANGPDRPTDWNSVNWRKANRQVRNLRQRIFGASQAGDLKKMQVLMACGSRGRRC